MDESVDPVIAVLGYPIGGNPVQFALERAFKALKLDWRVVSFELPPEHAGVALDGIEILGFRGVWLDKHLVQPAYQWAKLRTVDSQTKTKTPSRLTVPSPDFPLIDRLPELKKQIDCLYRNDPPSQRLQPSHQQLDWLLNSINDHFSSRGIHPQEWLVLGKGANRVDFPPSLDRILSADIIVIPPIDSLTSHQSQSDNSSVHQPANLSEVMILNAEHWPRNDANKLVVDLSEGGHPEIDIIRNHGYKVLGHFEQQVGSIQYAIFQWTGQTVSIDLLHEAVEEYLAI